MLKHLLLSAVLLAGIGAALATGARLRYADEIGYHTLAQNLASGRGFTGSDGNPTAYRPPGYPALLSLIYRVSDSALAGKLLNATALAFSALLLFHLAESLQVGAGRFVPLLILASPILFYATGTLYPQILGAFLLAAVLVLVCLPPARTWWFFLGGAVYGLLILTIPYFLLLLVAFPVFIFLARRSELLSALFVAALFVFGALLVVGPWTMRNWNAFHSLIPVSTNSGANLLLGNSEHASHDSGTNTDISAYSERAREMNEVDRDAFYRNAAWQWIRDNPGKALRLFAAKVLNHFNFRNRLATKGQSSRVTDLVAFLTYYPLLVASLVRLFFVRRIPLTNVEVFLYALYFGNALTSAVFFPRVRFRIPFDTILITIVAVFIARLLGGRSGTVKVASAAR